MKFTALCMMACLQASAWSIGQTVTLVREDISLQEVFREVNAQTGYTFLYNIEMLEKAHSVTLDFRNAPVERVLQACFRNQSLTYQIDEKTIVVREKLTRISLGKSRFVGVPIAVLQVSGKVTSTEGEPLPGVNVVEKGTTNGTATDVDGNYELDIAENGILKFSFIGYKTHEVEVANQEVINIILEEDIATLEGVVVMNTGYQTIAQERATGAFTTVNTEVLEGRFTPNIMNNLEGRVAGLVSYGNRVVVRGTGTLFAESRPLLVVDGLPVEMDYEDLNPFDIQSITILKDASASAIYGARATNGVIVVTTKRASEIDKIDVEVSSNVMVWQKRNVNYQDNWFMTPAQQVELENEYYRWFYNESPTAATDLASITNAINGTGNFNLDITPIQYDHYQLKTGAIDQAELDRRVALYSTRNFAKEYADNVLQNRILQMYNVAVRNRTDNFQSNLVLNFKNDNTGTIHNNDKQLNLFYKGTYDLTKWMTINFSVNNILQRSEERRSNGNETIFSPFSLPAYYSLFNPDGSQANISPGGTHYYNPYATWVEDNEALQPMHYHLLDELNLNKHKVERQNTRYHGELLFKIMDGLSVNTQYVYEVNRQSVSNYSEENSYVMRLMRNVYTTENLDGTYQYMIPPTGGRLATENSEGDHWTARAQLNFNRDFNEIHAVDFLAGVEFRETNTKGTRNIYLGWDDQLQTQSTTNVNYNELWNINTTSWYAPGYPARSFVFGPFIESAISNIPEIRRRNASGYANLTYTYDRRYNAFASVRKDYADVYGLATEFRGSPFGSAGIGWNLHHERFMADVKHVNTLKLRTSYGYTGNIYQGATSYMTATTGQTNVNTGLPRASIESPGNSELSWERTGTFNIGAEFTAFDNRLRGVLDWYNKKSEKVFSNQTLESTKGFSSLVMNVANVKNSGVELALAYDWLRPQNRDQFSWTTSGTASWNKNEVTRVESQASAAYEVISTGYKEGFPIRSLFSFRFAGLTEDGVQSWYAEDGRIIPSVGIQTSAPGSVYFTGQADPKHTFAMENRLSWKGFSLNLMMVYYGGHHMRANQVQILGRPSANPVRSWYLDAWTPTNTDTNVPGIWQFNASGGTQPAVQNNTDIFVQPADFLKIRTVVLGYDLPRTALTKVGLNALSLRFQIDNLPALYKSNDIGIDPETLGLRLPTNYVFGLNLRF